MLLLISLWVLFLSLILVFLLKIVWESATIVRRRRWGRNKRYFHRKLGILLKTLFLSLFSSENFRILDRILIFYLSLLGLFLDRFLFFNLFTLVLYFWLLLLFSFVFALEIHHFSLFSFWVRRFVVISSRKLTIMFGGGVRFTT